VSGRTKYFDLHPILNDDKSMPAQNWGLWIVLRSSNDG